MDPTDGYLLDTNVLVALMRGNPLGKQLEKEFSRDFDALHPRWLRRIFVGP